MLHLRHAGPALNLDERSRLARDLREDFGARLLNQLHLAPDARTAEHTRLLLGELRLLLDSLDPRSFSLRDCAQEWRAGTAELLASSEQVLLRWTLPRRWPELQLNPAQRCYPALILREFVRNALEHSRPRTIEVELGHGTAGIRLSARHDGLLRPPAQWRAARGLRLAALRAHDLGGSLQWSSAPAAPLQMDLQFPLAYARPHAKRTGR